MINLKMLGARHERGQTAIMTGLSMIVLVTLVGLVIDGGYAWGRQRETQNGSDSVAKAGAVVIQHWLASIGTETDGSVCRAIRDAALVNDVVLVSAEYTDGFGDRLSPPTPVDGAPCASTADIPDGAQGVKVTTEQTFDTFVAGVFGMQTWTALADATALVSAVETVCPASAGCGALPVTFPQTFDICDDNAQQYPLGGLQELGPSTDWEPYELIDEGEPLDADNLAILPLCPDNPGSVGWLDFGCGNLSNHIENPCNGTIPIPSWEQTHTGNINCCESELTDLTGPLWGTAEDDDKVVMIPIHRNTCSEDPVDGDDWTCMDLDEEWSGNGNNNFYHVIFWIGFKFDQAHVSGSDNECEQPDGSPQMVNPGGGVGCLKGWIVGRFDGPASVTLGNIDRDTLATTLVHLVE